MRRLRALWLRVMGMLRWGHVDKDFTAELDTHLTLHIEDGMRAGLSESEARRQALIKLGGVEKARQAHRDGRGLLWLENLVQDLRYGLRTLRRSPGFTITAVLTLGLGVGACTAIFSLVNAVLIRSLPYGDPERLVYLFTPNPNLKIPAEVICPSYGNFFDIKRESRLYANMSNFEQAMFSIGGQGPAQRTGAARVDESFFSTLESQPELGRAIGSGDVQPGHENVAVISHSLWVSMFGAKGDALERDLQLDGSHYRIIGVMPPEFEYPFKTDLPYGDSHIKSTQIWVPLVLDAKKKAQRDPDNNVSIARLRPGITIHEAQSEMSTIMARLDKQYAGDSTDFKGMGDWGALVEELHRHFDRPGAASHAAAAGERGAGSPDRMWKCSQPAAGACGGADARTGSAGSPGGGSQPHGPAITHRVAADLYRRWRAWHQPGVSVFANSAATRSG